MNENKIILYPSNWIYNAGVIGLVMNLEKRFDNENIDHLIPQLQDDGSVVFNRQIFSELNTRARFIDGNDRISIYRKGVYRNYLTTQAEKNVFLNYVQQLSTIQRTGNCGICNVGYYLPQNGTNMNFLQRNKEFNFAHNTLLGPTVNKFPNAYWNNSRGTDICHLCNFLILHHHIALLNFEYYEDIFINAPSFKVMFKLNKLVRETFGNQNQQEAKNKRAILATSVIDYANKIKSTLGIWTMMNVEIVSKYKVKNEKGQWDSRIEFFSLPFDIIKIISDRRIASILSDLGEFKILNRILDSKFSELTDIAYKLLKLSTKNYSELNQGDKKLLDSLLYRSVNKYNLTRTANKILKLYSLIEEKIKRR